MQRTDDDITLSQICDAIEKEKELNDGMHEINFGNQCDMNIEFPLSPPAEMQNVDTEMFGDFDLEGDRSSTSDNFETNSDESRFEGISVSEIKKLISS